MRWFLLLVLASCAGVDESDATSELSRPAVLGLHDGAINFCDNFEHWTSQPPDLAATARELGDTAWWMPLDVGTVRVSVPWDIALPGTADAALVTAHDPAGGWVQQHASALAAEQQCLDAWLAAAAAAHETVNIAFKPDYDYRDPSTNHILAPEIATYRRAVAQFVARYVPAVHVVTPWGEPDYANPHYPRGSTDRGAGCSDGCEGNSLGAITRAKEVFFLPRGSSGMDPQRARFDDPDCSDELDDTCGPVLAAQMWMAWLHACPDCVLASGATAGEPGSGIVAGDFSGGGGLGGGYLQLYAAHLDDCAGCRGERPPTWGLHPYPDASNEEWCVANTGHDFAPGAQHGANSVTVRFLDALHDVGYHEHTHVWLDEVSVFTHDNYAHGSPTPPAATNGASCGINRTTSIKPTYAPHVQARAVRWLVDTLPHVRGTRDPGHEPVVDRVYYFRSFAGTDPNGDNLTPTSPTANQQAMYDALVNR